MSNSLARNRKLRAMKRISPWRIAVKRGSQGEKSLPKAKFVYYCATCKKFVTNPLKMHNKEAH